MQFCANCGSPLDTAGGHVAGTHPCPGCGSHNYSTTVGVPTATATAEIPTLGITSQLAWSLFWLEVANKHLAEAYTARARYTADASGALADEFHHGTVAIVAASFAIEAEVIRATGVSEPRPSAKPPAVTGRKWSKGDYVGQYLTEQGAGDAQTTADLGDLFDLRNRSVHPNAKSEALLPHPIGTNTSPELVERNADIAAQHIALATKVVALFAGLAP